MLIIIIAIIVLKNEKIMDTTIIKSITNKEDKKSEKEPVINTDVSLLKGTFVYNDNVKYVFNENNTGTLYDNQNEYKYTYLIHDQQVTLTFEDESVRETTYTFYFVDDNLKLIGGEGTVGGEYILKKEK